MLRDAVAAFGIDARRVRRIPRGWVNEVWAVEDRRRRYVLKRVTPVRTDAELRHEHALLNALDDAGWLVPRPIPTLTGATLAGVDGARWWLADWIPGRAPIRDSVGFGRRTGRLLAQLHNAASKLNALPQVPRLRLREIEHWPFEPSGQTLSSGIATAPLERDLRRALQKAVASVSERLAVTGTLPEAMTHFDFHHRNLRVHRGRTAVLDFDFAHVDERAADIATALHFIPDPPVAEAFVDGYDEINHLEDDEHLSLPALYDARKLLHAAWLLTIPAGQDVAAGVRTAWRN